MKEQIKKINELIDLSTKENDGWWIDDNWHFEFNGVAYELLCHRDCYAYLTKAELKKEAKHIILTGNSSYE